MDIILEYLQSGLDSVIRYAPRIVIGIALLVVGWKGSGIIGGWLRKLLEKRQVDPTLVPFLATVISTLIKAAVVIGELADSSVNFTVRLWSKTGDYWDVFFDMHEAVKKTFDSEGISIPFPQQDVHMHQS